MQTGQIGDRLMVESERVGVPPREGEILKVLATGDALHYLIRWEDGHESTFFPGVGSTMVIRRKTKTRSGKTHPR